jgi:molybdenum cofactor cytidylyltransferase
VITGLLLAAGGARRFGSQKLLVSLHGTPIVRLAADALCATTDDVIVVVGNDAQRVQHALVGAPVQCVHNHEWDTGLASSLRCGVHAVAERGDAVSAVLVTLGDQPGLEPRVIRDVIALWREQRPSIVAVRYQGAQDHPVLFDRAVFPELLLVAGDTGAKPVLQRLPDRVVYLDVPYAAPRDVDTPADLKILSG